MEVYKYPYKVSGNKHTKEYAYEELVAEMTSALLCSYLGIENSVDDNHIAYVNSWIKNLHNKPQDIINAFKLSEEALAYIVDIAQLESSVVATETVEDTQPKKVGLLKKFVKQNKQIEKAKVVAKQQDEIKNVVTCEEIEENGLKFLLWKDGEAFMKLEKSYYDKLPKIEKSRIAKLWC